MARAPACHSLRSRPPILRVITALRSYSESFVVVQEQPQRPRTADCARVPDWYRAQRKRWTTHGVARGTPLPSCIR